MAESEDEREKESWKNERGRDIREEIEVEPTATEPGDKPQITQEKVRDILLNVNFHLQKADTK